MPQQNKVQIVVEVDSKTGQAQIKDLGNALESTSRQGAAANGGLATSMGGVQSAIAGLVAGFAAYSAVDYAKQTIALADKYTLLEARLKLVTRSAAELADVQSRLFYQSQDAGVAYANTVELYARLARSSESLNVSQARLLNITDLINKSMIVSGASTQEAGAALIQFSQGLASGALRGDELRSVMEQTPRLTAAIADGLGVTIGELKKMGEEGELTAEKVLIAIEKSGADIRAEFEKMPLTVSRATTEVGNSFGQLVDRVNEATGATKFLAEHLENVSHWLDIVSGNASKVTVGNLTADAKRRIAEIEQEMLAAAHRMDSPLELGIFKEGAKRQIQELAAELADLQEQLAYLQNPSDDPVKPLSDGVARASRSTKELTETWKDHHAAMALALPAEAAQIAKITDEYDAARQAVDDYYTKQYRGADGLHQELAAIAALDAAEQAKIAEVKAKSGEKEFKAKKDQAEAWFKLKKDLYEEGQKQESEAARTSFDTWKDSQAALAEITRQALPEHERALAAIEEKYTELDDAIRQLVLTGRMSAEEAAKWRHDLSLARDVDVSAANKAINSFVDKNREAAHTVPTLWDHATERMTDSLADWLASGENGLAGFERSFRAMVAQNVSTWVMGQGKMSSTQSASLGGNLALVGSMMGSASTGYSGLAAGGVGIINELLNPGAYMAQVGSVQSGLGSLLGTFGSSTVVGGTDLAFNFGSAGVVDGPIGAFIKGLSPGTFAAGLSGIGSFATTLLAGGSFEQAAASGVGSAAGSYIGSLILPGIGTILGSIAGSMLGNLFGGGGENQFTLSELNSNTADRWNRNSGIPLSQFYLSPSYNETAQWYAPIANSYVGGINDIDRQFNEQVTALKGKMSAAAWEAFATALEQQDLSDTNAGAWGVSGADSALKSIFTQYGQKLEGALNASVKAALPVLGHELLSGNSAYQYLSAGFKQKVQAALTDPGFSAASLDTLSQYLNGIANAIAPINEALETNGLSKYELALRGINQQFDASVQTLTAAGIDLATYPALARYRALVIGQATDEELRRRLAPIRQEVDSVLSGLKASLASLSQAKAALQAGNGAASQWPVARQALSTALQAARRGDLSAVGTVPYEALGQIDPSAYKSAEAYQRDYWSTYLSLAELEQLTGQAITAREDVAGLLKAQLDADAGFQADQLTTLDAQLGQLFGINAGIAALAGAVRAADAVPTATAAIPGFAAGGFHAGGWRVVGEDGPELEYTGPARIVSHQESSRLLDVSAVAEEIRQLRADMNRILYQVAKNTGQSYDQLRRWEYDGLPETRVPA